MPAENSFILFICSSRSLLESRMTIKKSEIDKIDLNILLNVDGISTNW